MTTPEDPDKDIPVYVGPSMLRQKLRSLVHLKEQKAAIQERIILLSAEIERELQKTAIYQRRDGTRMRATVVRPDPQVKVDLNHLREVDPQLFEKITKTVLDSPALGRALEDGSVTKATAEATMRLEEVKPYVLFTPLTEED